MNETPVQQVLARIREEAEAASDELRFVRTCREGDEIRQGDIYLYPLDAPPHRVGVDRASLQLAEGDTRGSRHILVGRAIAFDPPSLHDPLAGPFVQAWERVVLTHPEHADISIPEGWYEVRYQRDYTPVPPGIQIEGTESAPPGTEWSYADIVRRVVD